MGKINVLKTVTDTDKTIGYLYLQTKLTLGEKGDLYVIFIQKELNAIL